MIKWIQNSRLAYAFFGALLASGIVTGAFIGTLRQHVITESRVEALETHVAVQDTRQSNSEATVSEVRNRLDGIERVLLQIATKVGAR